MTGKAGRVPHLSDGCVGVHRPTLLGDEVGIHLADGGRGVHSGVEPAADLRAPFPWFGGKSRAADLIWDRFGDVPNYVEPFAGSLAVLLARPSTPKIETVNDIDCYLANFWRAMSVASAQVSYFADAPVNEADLHARHTWLVNRAEFRERMKTEPMYFDCKVAGWWVWGQCLWIGSGWCDTTNAAKIPNLTSGFGEGAGIHRRQIPDLSGDSGAAGRGLHASARLGAEGSPGILRYLTALGDRLRRVRVVCGDWSRVVTPAVTSGIGLTGVLLDPPYGGDHASDLYSGGDDRNLAADVRTWAIEHGDNPDLRIALCGFDGEHEMPESWECVGWKARGGYGSQRKDGENMNRKRERIWFSPHCLRPGLFSQETA